MKVLWTFETQPKLDRFLEILKDHEIEYELQAKGKLKATVPGFTVAVGERDFEHAKKLLLKHRKRRTSGDFS